MLDLCTTFLLNGRLLLEMTVIVLYYSGALAARQAEPPTHIEKKRKPMN